jgi:hypothetical protein
MGHLADATHYQAAVRLRAEVSMNRKTFLERSLYHLAGFGPLVFFLIASIEGFVRAGYDPIAQPISALALGPRGWIQELNFVLLAASLSSFAVILRAQLKHGASSLAGPTIAVIMTVGVTLAAIFPMDARGALPTTIGRLHVLGGFLVFPWMPALLLVAARRFRRDARWQPYFMYTLATGLFCLTVIVFFLLFVGPPGSSPRVASGLAGLVQRIQLLPFFTWMAVVSRRSYVELLGRAAAPLNHPRDVTAQRRQPV